MRPCRNCSKKIEAAAEARLTLPPDGTAAEKLARYKGFLKVETHRLKLLHRAGAGGREICAGRAAMLDALLRHLWATAQEQPVRRRRRRNFRRWRWWPSADMAARN